MELEIVLTYFILIQLHSRLHYFRGRKLLDFEEERSNGNAISENMVNNTKKVQ